MVVIQDLFRYPTFRQAQLIAGEAGLKNDVNGVMVMEAPDLDLWGRKGLLLLTGYHTLEGLSLDELAHFFWLAERTGIAGMVMKESPSIAFPPDYFITACENHQIPLIHLKKNVSFEKITTEVLEIILNRDAMVLKSYYDAHQQFNRLMMNQADLSALIGSLKEMIHRPISLLKKTLNSSVDTDEHLRSYTILDSSAFSLSSHMSFPHQKLRIRYKHYQSEKTFEQIVLPIPYHGHEEYELVVHKLGNPIQDFEFMMIENAVMAIQMELIKQNTLRHYNRTRLNEMASDLLHGRLTHQEDMMQTIHHLKLDATQQYHVVLIRFSGQTHADQAQQVLANRFTDALIYHSKLEFNKRTYVTRKRKLILIVPAQYANLLELKEKIQLMLKRVKKNRIYQDFKVSVTLSNAVELTALATGYSQAFDAQRILQLLGDHNSVAAYQDLGIYQVFMEEKQIAALAHFVPDNIRLLQSENPGLLETLFTFLATNQNHSETAEKLFVHPKTVRYRIDRLVTKYQIELSNPEKILQYQVGLRLLKFIQAQM